MVLSFGRGADLISANFAEGKTRDDAEGSSSHMTMSPSGMGGQKVGVSCRRDQVYRQATGLPISIGEGRVSDVSGIGTK